MQAISKISSRSFRIGTHACHRHVYLLWLVLICTVCWHLICVRRSLRTSFRLFCVSANLLIWSVWFWTICDKTILQSTSKARIWFPTIMFIAVIIVVVLIEGWFLISFFILNIFQVGVDINSNCTLIGENFLHWYFYWIFHIQTVDLHVRYR